MLEFWKIIKVHKPLKISFNVIKCINNNFMNGRITLWIVTVGPGPVSMSFTKVDLYDKSGIININLIEFGD